MFVSLILSFIKNFLNYFKELETKYLILILGILLLAIIAILAIVFISHHFKKVRSELRELDYLTKIYNRYYYYKKCKLFLSGKTKRYAIVAFDVDKFKLINEYYGTHEADKLLMSISEKLINFYKNEQIEIFGRIESDKFSFLMSSDKEKIRRVCEAIDSIKNTTTHTISFTFGVYFIEDNNMDIEQAYSRANIAAKSIKGSLDKTIAFFDSVMINRLNVEQFIINNIDEAILNEEIKVYFQPKYDLMEDNVCGAEALVRWIHPERGMISPADFVLALENNGLITKLDKFIWERTAKYISKWRSEGITPYPVSINISKVDLLENDLPEYLESLVRKYSIPHNLFELEITESAYVDSRIDVISILKKFKSKGFTILMDDFGSGYSSLNTLREFPIDILKIDLKFLSGFDNSKESEKGKTIVESIVSMAKHLNLKVVVEGTETIEQVEFCKSIGCEMAQGYFFSKPINAEDYLEIQKTGLKKGKKNLVSRLDEDSVWSNSLLKEDFFNSTLEALGVFILRRDNLEALRLNDRYFEIVGSTRKAYFSENRNILDEIYPDDFAYVLEKIDECRRTRSTVIFTYRRYRSDKSICFIKNKLTYVNNKDKMVSYFFSSLEDITSERLALLEVDNIINNLDYGFIKIDLSNNSISLYNKFILDLLKIDKDEFENNYKLNYETLFKEDEVETFKEKLFADSFKRVIKTKLKNGIDVAITCYFIRDKNNNFLYFNIVEY